VVVKNVQWQAALARARLLEREKSATLKGCTTPFRLRANMVPLPVQLSSSPVYAAAWEVGTARSNRHRVQHGAGVLRGQVGMCVPIGRLRMRLPVAAKIALHSAGVNVGNGGSPTPLACTS
jgi:hypothetical protein